MDKRSEKINKIYFAILSLYDLIESINTELLKNEQDINNLKKETILRNLYANLNKNVDSILKYYIKFMKNDNSRKVKVLLLKELDNIINYIAICKNKIYYLYKK